MILDALYNYGVKSPVNTLYFNYLPEIRNLMEIGKYQKSPKWENESTRPGECFHLFCLALARRLLCAMRSLQVSEAGDIEQDASIIILLWNLDNEDKTRKGLKVDKNRQGELGKIVYRFDGNEMRFQETEEELKSKDGFKTVRTPTPFD